MSDILDTPNSAIETLNKASSILDEKLFAERSFDLQRMYTVAMIRESGHPQFDDMGYVKWNETNEMADMSYLPKKANKEDTVITSGVTHEKDSSILSLVSGYNFEPRIRVYKNKEELYDLGESLTAWVRKSRDDERYDEKRPIIYRNGIVQGTCFCEVKFSQKFRPSKKITSEIDYSQLDKVTWLDTGYDKVNEGTITKLIDGKKVFLENIREQDIRNQPGIYTIEYVPRTIAESIWGKSSMWKYVPDTAVPNMNLGFVAMGSIYSDWPFSEIDKTKVEIITVQRPFDNRYQVYINSVPMLKAGYPLDVVSPSGISNIAKFDLDPMNMFAYSKGIASKTKIDQAVYDAILKGMIIKHQQSTFVPRGNLSERAISSSVLMPGKITKDLRAEDIPPLIENPGITQSEFNFYQSIKEMIDSKSISNIMEGNNAGVQMTGTQYMDMQKKQMLRVGGIIQAFINFEKQLGYLTLMSILQNATKPIGTMKDPNTGRMTNKYKDVVVSDTFGSSKGNRIINLTEDNYDSTRQPIDVMQEEEDYKAQTGKNIKNDYVDPVQLAGIINNPDYYICVEVVPVDKGNDALTKALFIEIITQAANLFGMDSLNVDELKKRYASVMGEEFDDLFLSPEVLQMKQQQALMQEQAVAQAPQTTQEPQTTQIDKISEQKDVTQL